MLDKNFIGAFNTKKYILISILCLIIWIVFYSSIIPFSQWITYSFLGLEENTPIAMAFEFFFYDTPKILLLLVLMVYILAVLRAGFNTEKINSYLVGKGKLFGYTLASFFGSVTPFCSCSSIPLFISFTNSRIPLGITMSFLITSPLINEVAIVILWGLLGWKLTLIYIVAGILSGIIGGLIIDLLRAERWLQPFLQNSLNPKKSFGGSLSVSIKPTLIQRHTIAFEETKKIVKQVWLWVVIGVGIGAGLHGYVPQEWFEQHFSNSDFWSVPLAVIAGIPLYTGATGIIPIMESLLMKGMPLGTTFAFCMSAVGASLPEILMLKQVMRPQLLATFIIILLVLFTLIGWLLNFVGMV